MALSAHRYIFLLVTAVCCFSLDSLSAEGTTYENIDSSMVRQGLTNTELLRTVSCDGFAKTWYTKYRQLVMYERK
ncbi:hypothetical protein HOLleu_23692 [Holothuria leucospilota]|uniref:Uncharacterized protein n=1 Tax=Holothuria leucospilota TaxID=206669 RepID=A0A9Q1H326_HOLLE|nr:hypothetical protein HOLleu_23692 [Holothuria leucospilota]